MAFTPEAITAASSRHPWRTIVAWIVLVVTMGYLTSTLLAGVLTTDIAFTTKPESVRAQDILDEEFSGVGDLNEYVIVRSNEHRVQDQAFQDYVTELTAAYDELPSSVVDDNVTNVYEIRDDIDALVLPNDNGVMIPLSILAETKDTDPRFEDALRAVQHVAREDGHEGFSAELVRPQALLSRPIGRASDGAGKLAHGTKQAAGGAADLREALRALDRGAGSLAEGIASAADGAAGLADGIDGAAVGAQALADGAGGIAAGNNGLYQGLSALAEALRQMQSGAHGLAQGARGAGNDAQRAADHAGDARNDVNEMGNDAQQIQDALSDLAASNPGLASDPDFQRAMDDARAIESEADRVANDLDGVQDDADSAASTINGIADAADQLADGLSEVRDGLRSAAGGSRQLGNGASKLAAGITALGQGLAQAASGANQLATGIDAAADGADGLGDGAGAIGDGAGGLHEGLNAVARGNDALSDGLGEGAESFRDMELGTASTNEDGDELRTMLVLLKTKGDNALEQPAFADFTSAVVSALASTSDGDLDVAPINYFDINDRADALVSDDESATLIPVTITESSAHIVEVLREVADAHERDGFEVLQVGQATLQADTTEVAEQDLKTGEGIGMIVALAVLIGVFGALVAAFLPLGTALVSIPVAMGMVALLGQIFEFNLFTQNMISMIGLAVGIDYSLFIVARYREERQRGAEKMDAIARTGGTASRAVLFSGLTVVFALMGMFILPTTIFRSMATGSILVVLASIAASLTLLPAMLALLGDKINWPRITKRARMEGDADNKGGFWDRATRAVMRRPVVALTISVLILGSLASVYFQIIPGTSQGASSMPDAVESKAAFEVLTEEFAGGQTNPIDIVVRATPQEAAASVAALTTAIQSDARFDDEVTVQPADSGHAVLVTALFTGDAFSNESFQGIRDLRAEMIPAAFDGTGTEVAVGGTSAFFTDFLDTADKYQPWVIAFVLGMSFILLMMVFRSVVVPLKAMAMNLLSVGAAYGAIVLVFQKGVGLNLFNALGFRFQRVEAIEAWLPLMLFSILFGLSMDYHVFLLSRIKERYDHTHDNDEAVAFGLRTTAGIITGAALIMVAVFTGFAAGSLTMMQQMGFGLAVAVLLDATIVRSVLVPASMKLLGDRNWYFPKWLHWMPHLNVEGHVEPIEDAGHPEDPEADGGGGSGLDAPDADPEADPDTGLDPDRAPEPVAV